MADTKLGALGSIARRLWFKLPDAIMLWITIGWHTQNGVFKRDNERNLARLVGDMYMGATICCFLYLAAGSAICAICKTATSPDIIGLVAVAFQTGLMENVSGAGIRTFKDFGNRHTQGAPLFHYDRAIHDDSVHICRSGEMRDPVQRHHRRVEMRLEPVNKDDIGFFARLKRAKLMIKSKRAGRADCRHLQCLAFGQNSRVAKVASVIMHALRHVAEHIIPAIGCCSVGAKRHIHTKVQQFRDRTATKD